MRPLFWPALLLLAACGGPEANVRSEDPYERFLGQQELVDRTDAAAMAELVAMLDDPHFLVVVGAVEMLGHRARPEFLQHLHPKLKHPHPLVRQAAAISLGMIQNPDGVPALIATLKDPDPSVRRGALKGLAWYGDVKAAMLASADALADKDPSVSYMAHRVLLQKSGKTVEGRNREAWLEALK